MYLVLLPRLIQGMDIDVEHGILTGKQSVEVNYVPIQRVIVRLVIRIFMEICVFPVQEYERVFFSSV